MSASGAAPSAGTCGRQVATTALKSALAMLAVIHGCAVGGMPSVPQKVPRCEATAVTPESLSNPAQSAMTLMQTKDASSANVGSGWQSDSESAGRITRSGSDLNGCSSLWATAPPQLPAARKLARTQLAELLKCMLLSSPESASYMDSPTCLGTTDDYRHARLKRCLPFGILEPKWQQTVKIPTHPPGRCQENVTSTPCLCSDL